MFEGQHPQGSLVGVTIGSYQVTDRIGAGGMGVVYRARDLRLGRTVAVKAVSPATEADPAARRKLMDEARRASRVVSPYVATVFDVVDRDDSAYIVMEHIDGRRLDVVLRQDRPVLATVTGFAVEIAEALTAIHRAGLVHRDLKPANVMITPAGHVKVMDFGLAREDAAAVLRDARRDSTRSTRSAPGAVAGTILYMSPEQVRGEPLDARSDLFSFGTLLYEAVTGNHPFERESMLASASAILNEPPAGNPEPPQLASSPVGAIVHRLLDKDRERRYASAAALLDDLRAVRSGAVLAAASTETGVRRRALTTATAAVAMAAVAVTAYLLWQARPPKGDAPRPALAVLPFEDRTGEPRGDLRGQLLAELLAADLAESTLVRALPSDRVREILSGIDPHAPPSRALAAVHGAADVRWIVAGSLFKENDALYATVNVYQPGKSEPSEAFRASAGATAAIAALAGAKLREVLFPGRKDATATTGKGVTGESGSEEAQLLAQEAKRAVRELRYGEAIEKLEKAARLDPGFLAAQVRLAEALDRAGYAARARECADRALRTVEPLGGDAQNEPLALEARAVHARIHGNADGEIAARRALVARHGDDPARRLALARALDSRGRATEALLEVDLGIALDPKDPSSRLVKARVLCRAERCEESAAELDRAEALVTEMGSSIGRAAVDRVRADADYARSLYPRAQAGYETAARAFSAAGLGVLAAQCRKGAGDCELMQGKLDAAVAIYEPVLAVARSAGDHRTIVATLSSLGGQYLVRGRLEQAERTLREAREDALGLGNPQLLAGPTLNLASVLDASGHGGESRALAEEALALGRDTENNEIQSKALLLLANAHFRDGRLDDAIRSYREVLEAPPLAHAPGTPLGNIHLGLADILREVGRMKEAADSAELAVAVNRAGSQPVLLGYSLVARARIRVELALDAAAEGDLDEAAKIASDPSASLLNLRRRVRLGRAILAAARSRWDDAETTLAGLRGDTSPESGEGIDVTVLALSAEVAIEQGRNDDAMRYARRVVTEATASPVDRTRSRVDLARAAARHGSRASAGEEARRGLDEADRMGLALVTAQACAILVELGESLDTEAIRAKGKAALERYLDAAPEDRRVAVRARNDLRAMSRILEGKTAASRVR